MRRAGAERTSQTTPAWREHHCARKRWLTETLNFNSTWQEIKSLGMLKEEAWGYLQYNTTNILFSSTKFLFGIFFSHFFFFSFQVQMFTISAAQEANPSVSIFTAPLKQHPIPPVGTRQTQPHSVFCPFLLYPAHKTSPSAKSPSDRGWGLESWL